MPYSASGSDISANAGSVVWVGTVSISGVQFASGFSDHLGVLFGGPSSLTTAPPTSITFVGEDLSKGGA